jgi:hypothetical protein
VAVHEEARRLDIELFADVFADLDQIMTALAAGTRIRLMAVFNPRQVIRQRLTTGAGAGLAWRQRFGCHQRRAPGQFRLGRRQIAGQGFLEQVPLLGRQGFVAHPKAHPAQVRQFQGESLNLGLGATQFRFAQRDLPADFSAVFLRLIQLRPKRAREPLRQRGIGAKTRQFRE